MEIEPLFEPVFVFFVVFTVFIYCYLGSRPPRRSQFATNDNSTATADNDEVTDAEVASLLDRLNQIKSQAETNGVKSKDD